MAINLVGPAKGRSGPPAPRTYVVFAPLQAMVGEVGLAQADLIADAVPTFIGEARGVLWDLTGQLLRVLVVLRNRLVALNVGRHSVLPEP